MSDWILTNTYDLASRRGKSGAPNNPHVMLSPYFVPEALRSYLDGENIVVEFRYISIDESRYPHQERPGVAFEIGQKTGRIYKIFISISLFESKNFIEIITQSLESAVKTFASQPDAKRAKTTKYSATLSSLKENANRLEASIDFQHAH